MKLQSFVCVAYVHAVESERVQVHVQPQRTVAELFERFRLAEGRNVGVADLKHRDLGERMIHNGYWLDKFQQQLYANGIMPDRR